ncbi:MAG: 50S ribosomal protein L11 methyltransferase, partial [Eudoraea sp.]|nr:50S ribosomal protein L11 methyltransferase [Eudoraea sp.]
HPFDSFIETDSGLNAYIKKSDFREGIFNDIQILSKPDFKISFESRELVQQNWNARWEENFKPITVDNRCSVRAPFHEEFREVEYDIVIMPKMSFGTGHHETTQMMLEHLLEMPVAGLSVLDMGCGTGVLAILAAMKGATLVDAIDIDHWSYLNTMENIERNGQHHINVYEGDIGLLGERQYNLILANINRNILLSDIPAYVKQLQKNGKLILSGFYREDLGLISETCDNAKLKFVKKKELNNWLAVVYEF